MTQLSEAHKNECDMTLALLKEATHSKEVMRARIKSLDAVRNNVNGSEFQAIAAYLSDGIETEIPEHLRWRAEDILFGENALLGATGVLYSYADALKTPTTTEWIVEGLFAPCSVSLICGTGGSKKTYSMIDLAVAVARGGDWLGFDVPDPTIALFIDEESGPRRFARRLCVTGHAHEADPDLPLFYISLAGYDLTSLEGQDKLHKLINETGARLVILDALVDLMPGGDENAVSDVQPIFVGLRRIAEMTQSAIVIIHHTNRSGGYRGSSALKGAVDIMLMVDSDANEQLVTFKTEKARDIEPVTFHALANFGDGTFNLSPIAGPKRADQLQPLIDGWLSEAAELNQSELVEFGKEKGIGRNSVIKALAEMETAGTISSRIGPANAKVYTVTS